MSNAKLFVGNIPFKLNESDLEQLFSDWGKVVSVAIPVDRDTGRKRGFAFVEMSSEAEAEAAIQNMNGQVVEGLIVLQSRMSLYGILLCVCTIFGDGRGWNTCSRACVNSANTAGTPVRGSRDALAAGSTADLRSIKISTAARTCARLRYVGAPQHDL